MRTVLHQIAKVKVFYIWSLKGKHFSWLLRFGVALSSNKSIVFFVILSCSPIFHALLKWTACNFHFHWQVRLAFFMCRTFSPWDRHIAQNICIASVNSNHLNFLFYFFKFVFGNFFSNILLIDNFSAIWCHAKVCLVK